jgi:D-3-phosphoglycerate dehydrogenase
MAMMYACARALSRGQQSLNAHFGEPPIPQILEFHNKVLGIIGLGRIGGTLCRKVRPLFDKVLATDPYIPDERFTALGAINTNLKDLLAQSDVISIHCNLTEETTGLINAETIGMMCKKPILINTSRGPVIHEDDLLEGIQLEKIHSVGLDVFCDEPPLANRDELLSHPKVIATGHYAWYSVTSAIELQKRAADNLLSMLKGQIPEDCLNP